MSRTPAPCIVWASTLGRPRQWIAGKDAEGNWTWTASRAEAMPFPGLTVARAVVKRYRATSGLARTQRFAGYEVLKEAR